VAFQPSDRIDSHVMYTSEVSHHSEGWSISAIGFLGDGRAIFNGYNLPTMETENLARNGWDTSTAVGYYRVSGEAISFEFLTSDDFGQYVRWDGIVKGDSVIFSGWRIGKNKRYVFVKSGLPLQSD